MKKKLTGLKGLGKPKPAKNPSLTGHKGNRFAKPVTLPKLLRKVSDDKP
jgi:hypothetical protein